MPQSASFPHVAEGEVFFSGNVDWFQGRVREGCRVVHDPAREHTKFRSTGLFVGEHWNDVMGDDVRLHNGAPPNPSNSVCLFHVGTRSAGEIRDQVTSGERVAIGERFGLDSGTHELLGSILHDAIPVSTSWAIDRQAILIASNPSAALSTGRTTNGLHFDDPELAPTLRVGINLGDVDRYVYYVPRARATIPEAAGCTEGGDGYDVLADLELRPLSLRIRAGEGWTMPTTSYLHDGRRAVAHGLSQFLLAVARLSVVR